MANVVRTAGDVGARLDLRVRRGQDMTQVQVQLFQDEAGVTPVDLTGFALTALARTRGDVPATKLMVVTVEDAAQGVVLIDMTKDVTATIETGPRVTSPPAVCDWGLRVVEPGGREFTVLYGELEVSGELPV